MTKFTLRFGSKTGEKAYRRFGTSTVQSIPRHEHEFMDIHYEVN